jgi:HPt (histidine-containing phosphotransfer) domain-containing protein
MIRAMVPDLELRLPKFTVLTTPPDRELRLAFFSYLDGILPDLHAAATRGDLARVAQIAHGLKGAGGSVGFPELSAFSERCEEVARNADAAATGVMVGGLHAWRQAMGDAA